MYGMGVPCGAQRGAINVPVKQEAFVNHVQKHSRIRVSMRVPFGPCFRPGQRMARLIGGGLLSN